MAFTKYPFFYNSLWNYMHPLTKSIEFDNLCKRLVIISKKSIRIRTKTFNKKLKKIGYNNYEIKKLMKLIKFLLLVICLT